MNYYEHHLGDWAAATGHLTWDEDMAYTRLLRAYYHHEKPIADGQQYRLAKASTPAQKRAVDQVLSEFFELRDGAYHQKRADAEIARYQDKQRKAKASANARWSQCERIPDAMRTHSEGNALQTPVTRHQENPPTPRKRGKPALPAGFDEFWESYPRRVAKGTAVKAWAKLAPDDALRQCVLKALNRAKSDPEWQREGGRYIPHPATWLNAARWLDEPVRIVSQVPAVEVWTPPPPPTAEERAASEEARRRVMAAVRISA